MKNRKFVIPKIEEEKGSGNNQGFGEFVGPFSGRNAANKEVYPYVSYGNKGRQYQGLNPNLNNQNNNYDKYSPDRIPSYLRPEKGGSGISRSNISYLKGEKMSLEEMRRINGLVPKTEEKEEEFNLDEDINLNDYQDELENNNVNNYNKVNNYQQADNYQQLDNYKQEVKPVVKNYDFNDYEEDEYDDGLEEFEDEDYEEEGFEEEFEVQKPSNNPFKQFSPENYKQEPVKKVQNEMNVRNNKSIRPVTGMKNDDNDSFYEKELDFIHVSKPQVQSNVTRNEPVKEVKKAHTRKKKYVAPPLNILKKNGLSTTPNSDVQFQINTINQTLQEFKVGGHVLRYTKGPTVTQFEIKLDPGVNVNKVSNISKNLQMNLASDTIRIEAPIPGKPSVGIEVPNPVKDKVLFGDLMSNKDYLRDGKPLNIVLGQQIDGQFKYVDITSMPHALVAGATGSGKTVCLYSIIASILYKATPDEVKLILIDPKSNELTFFNDIPHLACPVIDDPKVATASIKWAVEEMGRRYSLLKSTRKRTIVDYNEYVEQTGEGSKIPYIVIVIDEFADLMNTASDSFETNVQRLTQKARSAGIHMVIATQRPSTDVIKGTIKANITTRIAFNVNSNVDSITILDHMGAEKLLGKGDMLYTNGGNDIRVQGAYITEHEIEAIADYLVEQNNVDYMFTLDELNATVEAESNGGEEGGDELFEDFARHVVKYRNASMNQIQKVFRISYNRADSLMNELEALGVVSPVVPGRQRTVLVDMEELERLLYNNRK